MKKIFLILLLMKFTGSVQAQDYQWQRVSLTGGSAWSFTEGDEYLFLNLHIPAFNKLHAGLNYGYRSRDIKTQQAGVSLAYDVATTGPRRLYVKTDFSYFFREGSIVFDHRFFRHSFGAGYTTILLKRAVLFSEVNLVGFYYGTRKDPPQYPAHPSVFGAGEFKLGFGYQF